jgi:hypothetical protein
VIDRLDGKDERDWYIREGGKGRCLGSCTALGLRGRETEGKMVVVYCLGVSAPLPLFKSLEDFGIRRSRHKVSGIQGIIL